MKILISFYIIYLFVQNIISECNLKIADNELSSFKGGKDLIYDDGVIKDDWNDNNSFSSHLSSMNSDIEYLYATEIHSSGSHKKIVILNFI